jgi:RNA polymerase sigma-70 factor (ECF subfamily)
VVLLNAEDTGKRDMWQLGIPNAPMDAEQLCQRIQAVSDQMEMEANLSTFYGKSNSLHASLLEMLIQQYHRSLSAYAFSLLGMDDAAQDVIQDTWMALYLYVQQQSPAWATHANIPAWLWTVVKNKAINYNKVQRRTSSLDSGNTTFVFEPHVPRFDYPENTAIREDVCRVLYQAVKALRKPQRDVIAYRFFYDCSLDEIAQALGVPLNTVKARLSRGKKQLQKLLVARGVECSDLGFWTLERYPKILLRE